MEEKIYYESNGIKLCGILNKTSDDKIVILCHGIRGNKEECGSFTELASKLHEVRISSFRFDFNGHGESEGQDYEMTITKEIEDLKNTIIMLKEKGYKHFVLVGGSFGASIVSLLQYHDYEMIKGIVLWYGALDYEYIKYGNLFSEENKRIAEANGYYLSRSLHGNNNFKFSLELFKEIDKYKPYAELQKNQVPKLFVHGDLDTAVPYQLSEKVANSCTNSKFVLIKNGEHTFQNDKKAIEEAVNVTVEYINKIL